MESTLQSQLYIFLLSLAGGVIIALIYDFYRLSRYYSKPKRIKTFIQDLIFWLVLSLIIILFVNRVNEGEIRGFIFLGFTIGILLYSRLLSKKVIRFISYTIDLFISQVKKVMGFILSPFKSVRDELFKSLRKFKKYLNVPRIFYDNTMKSISTITKKK